MTLPYLVGGVPRVLRAERLGKGEHSPRHFFQYCCYSFHLSSIHAANPKHWARRYLMCQTRQEFCQPSRQGLARWHCLTAPHSSTAPSRTVKCYALFRLYALHQRFASSNSSSSTTSSYLLERTWFIKNTGPDLNSHAGNDFPFGDYRSKLKNCSCRVAFVLVHRSE